MIAITLSPKFQIAMSGIELLVRTAKAAKRRNFRRMLESKLAQSSVGRIILNVGAMIGRPRKARFFFRGVLREMRSILKIAK